MNISKIYTPFLLLLLVGCEITNNPREGGLISGIVNIRNGGYDQRVDSLKSRAEKAREQSIKWAEKNELLSQDQKNQTKELVLINAGISQTNRKIEELNDLIHSGELNNQEIEKRLSNIKDEIDITNTNIEILKGSSVDPVELEQLRADKEKLMEYFLALFELVQGQL